MLTIKMFLHIINPFSPKLTQNPIKTKNYLQNLIKFILIENLKVTMNFPTEY